VCVTSAVFDYFGQGPGQSAPWTPAVYNEFQEILKRLEELDKKLGQPHCEDPAKAAWMREVEERLAKLEEEE